MQSVTIRNEHITGPGRLLTVGINRADGIGFMDEVEVLVQDCVVDFSDRELEDCDEAASLTWGAQGKFVNCTIRGAGKLFLCGSGDAHKADVERGKIVRLINCTLEDFGRRGPEVQAGMHVIMENCTIRNWGDDDRFDCRIFGAWAHSGGKITAIGCRFEQPSFWRSPSVMFRDLLGHIGQAVNDEGILALFKPKTWLPGVCRGLVAGPGGEVEAIGCSKNRFWIRIENHKKS